MATKRSFNNMLLEYLHYDLLKEEHNKRNYFMQKVERDNGWKDGPLPVAFEAAQESSFKMGGLTDENDIAEAKFVKGYAPQQAEIWGTMQWNERDLAEHSGTGGGDSVSEQSFLKNLPKRLTGFMDAMKEIVSTALLAGSHLGFVTVQGTAGGVIEVDRPERFVIGQKLVAVDGNSTVTCYVIAIDINANQLTVSATRGGAAMNATAVDLGAKLYIDGAEISANRFVDIVDQLLPASAGGSATIFGVSKIAQPYTQAIAIDGSGISSVNVLESIFDAWGEVIRKGRGTTDKTLLMSYKHMGNVMKQLEKGSGAYRHVDTKVSAYGYTEVKVSGPKGVVTLASVQEMRDDVMVFIDWSALKFHTNGDFHIHKDPEGKAYYTKRVSGANGGYLYLTDICLRGQLVVHSPAKMAVIHSIP
jgi:hypothetical protein